MSDHICDPASSWELKDAYGIYCARVCGVCEVEKRARFRPEIFEGLYECDEPIDED